jgi:hypothetical protein
VVDLLSRVNAVLDHTVVRARVALAEEVGLDLVVDATEELPIDLVEVVALEDDGADDSLAGSGLHGDIDAAEEEVEVGVYGGSLAGLFDAELSALVVVGDGGVGGLGPAVFGAGV